MPMKTIVVVMLVLLLLTACSSEDKQVSQLLPPTEKENSYAEAYGWHITDVVSEGKTTLEKFYPEQIEALQLAGVDVTACDSGQINTRHFSLAEKQQDGATISLSIYYCDDERIGGVGGLENWSPGMFAIHDKSRLIEQGTLAEQ
jgi:hypothetical protein